MNKFWRKIIDISGWETYKAKMKHRFKPDPVDGTQFNDPVALRISWKPLKHTGQLFPRRLRGRTDYRRSFRLRRLFTLAALLFPLVISVFVYKIWFLLLPWLVIGYGLVLWLLYLGSPPVSADRRKGILCKGRGRKKVVVPLEDVHALQLLSFFYQDDDPGSSGEVYQLNLIRHDHRREELVTQRTPPLRVSREAIIDDANKLACFLDVPLWDAIASYDR